MAYVQTNWVEGGAPAISAANLNKIEKGIRDASVLAENAFPGSGGTLQGSINFVRENGIKTEGTLAIDFFGPGNSGYGMAIGAGGLTIIGGGEGAQTAKSGLMAANGMNAGEEQMHVVSDNHVHIVANLQDGWADRVMWRFTDESNVESPNANGAIFDQHFNVRRKSGATNGYWGVLGPTGTVLHRVNWDGSGSIIEKGLIIDNVADVSETNTNGLTIRGGAGAVKIDDNELISVDTAGKLKTFAINAAQLNVGSDRVHTVGGSIRWGTGGPSGGENGDIYIQY